MNHLLFLLLLFAAANALEPTWKSLDARPLPEWYDNAKFGIFLHWGVFSVPSFGSAWFWQYWQGNHNPNYRDFVDKTEHPHFSYTEYAARFQAELYNPDQWAQIFANAGAQYVVLTSKHHEGFCLWNSTNIPTTWNWNAVEVGPRRDVLGDLAAAVQATTSPHTGLPIQFGLYHSLFEWFNPLYLQDKANNFTTSHFVDLKTGPELYDLVKRYKPTLVWSDGEWDAPSSYWKSTKFLHWYATASPVADQAVWNDRWGRDTLCKHGGFLTCSDRYSPGQLNLKKWENAFTIDRTSWVLNRNTTFAEYFTVCELIHILIEVVAFNGNFLLNAGPAADGTLHPIFVDRLLGMGKWLQVNGEAIFGTRPWLVAQNETASNVYYTRKSDRLYVHLTTWPQDSRLRLHFPIPTPKTTVSFLGVHDNNITWSKLDADLVIQLPLLTPDRLPCEHAWVLVLTHIDNLDPPVHDIL